MRMWWSKTLVGGGRLFTVHTKWIHGSRHRRAKMKFWSGPKGKAFLENNRWSFANKQARKYRGNSLFGLN